MSSESSESCEACLQGKQHPLYFYAAVNLKGGTRVALSRNPVERIEEENAQHRKRAKKPAANPKPWWQLVLAIGPFVEQQASAAASAVAAHDGVLRRTVSRIAAIGLSSQKWYSDNDRASLERALT